MINKFIFYKKLYGIAIPLLAVWGVLLPLLLYTHLKKYEKYLQNERFISKYGFVYLGYKHEYFYWYDF